VSRRAINAAISPEYSLSVIHDVDLKNILCQVYANYRNLHLRRPLSLFRGLQATTTLDMSKKMTKQKFSQRKLRQIGNMFDLELINAADPEELLGALLKYRGSESEFSKDQSRAFLAFVLKNFNFTKSQIFQDLFVLFMTYEKKAGFFFEFGATNGITLSNSWLLEKSYGWDGILAEPARCWHTELRANRTCKIDTNCVWSKSGEQLEFNEASSQELSTINFFSGSDGHSSGRQNGNKYMVETITLNDLLEKHNAPREIDYLSIDTEGSELTILSNFDFNKYNINLITVEHNFTDARNKIYDLLSTNGYKRLFAKFSKFDDWYIKV
jgi:FkbM family methyltransferase